MIDETKIEHKDRDAEVDFLIMNLLFKFFVMLVVIALIVLGFITWIVLTK